MNKNIRIRTQVGKDNYLKIKLEQEFDFLEILSLKISQEEIYEQFNSDYGVIVGRIYLNNGLGAPNAKVSIFIPKDSNDVLPYMFDNIKDKDENNIRYNLLPNQYQNQCHSPVGTFPSKNQILDNEHLFEVYDKYYKFSTITNNAGDFMLFGVPVGNHILNVDVDLSDIGIFSQRPYDFINQGSSTKQFESPTKFKESNNLDTLTQIRHQEIGVNVVSLWGENLNNEIGVTRVDVDLNFSIIPNAIFIGSIFGDNEKNSVNKNCHPRKKLGKICETVSSEGAINMIRKTMDNSIENFDVDGGRLIDSDGTWAYQIPMNLDYMVTDEFGVLTPSNDPNKGIATRSRVRFKIGMDGTGGDGRLRTRANFLVPHNPSNLNDQDFNFDENTSDNHFRDLYWNQIYTVKNHIARVQSECGGNCVDNRRMIGIKDVDDCVGVKNPFPFNRLDSDFNPLFLVICIVLQVIIIILSALNKVLSFIHNIRIPVIKYYPFKSVKCIKLNCDGTNFAPGCYGNASENTNNSGDDLHECYKILLAEQLNVYEFDFYNDWVNGTLYSFLLKYKKKKDNEKFCSSDVNEESYIVDSLTGGKLKDYKSVKINHGYVKKYGDDLFYSPLDVDNGYLLFATDIYNLGAIFNNDWLANPKIHNFLIPSSYQIPPFQITDEPNTTSIANDGKPQHGLLFDIDCTKIFTNLTQNNNIKRLCEIGVGLDEDRGSSGKNGVIGNEDIENIFIRDMLCLLNDDLVNINNLPINTNFDSLDYENYRKKVNYNISQIKGNSYYFYFGGESNNSAIDKMNSRFFTTCEQKIKEDFIIVGVITNVSYIGGNDGSISINVIGGQEPFTYEWSNGETTSSISNLTTGSYSLIITDYNGSTNKRFFYVKEPQPLIAVAIPKNTTGSGVSDGKIYLNTIIGGNGDYFVTLSGPSGFFSVSNPSLVYEFNNLSVGNYTLTIVDSSIQQLTFTSSIQVSDPPPLVSVVEFNNSKCNEPNTSTIEITVTGGVPPYSIITNGLNLLDISGNPIQYTSNYLFQGALIKGNYSVDVQDSVGQQSTQHLGYIDIPEKDEFILDGNISYPYRVRVLNFQAGITYDFYLNEFEDEGDKVGSIVYDDNFLIPDTTFENPNFNVLGYFNYPPFVSGDKLMFKNRDLGCDSNIIEII